MKKAIITTFVSSLFLTGCTTALTVADWLVTPIGTGVHHYYTYEELFGPYIQAEKQFAENQASTTEFQAIPVSWVNAQSSKKQGCKVPKVNDDDMKVYWDGECEDGHATGLGRIIMLGDNVHQEWIIDLDEPLEESPMPFVLRDFLAKKTIRGYFVRGFNRPNAIYGNEESIIEDNRSGDVRLQNYEGIKDQDLWAYRGYLVSQIFTIVKINGLSYGRGKALIPNSNGFNKFVTLGFPQYSIQDMNGVTNTRVLGMLSSNSKRQIVWAQNGRPEVIGGIVGSGIDYFAKGEYIIDNVEQQLDKYYQAAIDLEQKYMLKLKSNPTIPRGLTREIYYDIVSYYSDDLMSRISDTKSRDIAIEMNKIKLQELELSRRQARARASSRALNNQLNQQVNKIINDTQNNINNFDYSYTPPAVLPMQ